MTTPLLLLAIATTLGVLGGRVLSRAVWPQVAPRLAVAVWQAISCTVVTSVILAGLAFALPVMPVTFTSDLADFLGACSLALRDHYATPGGATTALAGVALVLLVMGRLAHRTIATVAEVRRSRRRQHQALSLLGNQPPAWPDIRVVDDSRPVVYCLPGRRGGVVVTTGALHRLPADQLTAVLAHERAHLRGRHALVSLYTAVLADAFGFVPLFRAAQREVPGLLEMAADDAAVRTGGRMALARALVTLAGAAAPAGALAAGGGSALNRVVRLSQPSSSLGWGRAGLLIVGLVVALVVPVAIVAAPAVSAAAMDYCPLPFSA